MPPCTVCVVLNSNSAFSHYLWLCPLHGSQSESGRPGDKTWYHSMLHAISPPLLAEILSSSKTTLRQDEYLCGIQLELSLARPTGVLEISEPQQLGPSFHVQPAVVAGIANRAERDEKQQNPTLNP